MTGMGMLTLRLPWEMLDELSRRAEADGRSRSNYVRQVLAAALEAEDV